MTPDELRAARRKLGVSVAELARLLQLDDSKGNAARTVRRWETGEVPISGPVQVAVRLLLEKQA
jgi:DNA-binding transcriptional regulator YiaG